MSIFSTLSDFFAGVFRHIGTATADMIGHSLTGALLWTGGAVAVTAGIWLYERKAGQS